VYSSPTIHSFMGLLSHRGVVVKLHLYFLMRNFLPPLTSEVEMNVKRQEERRRQERFVIGCPVTALTPGQGRKRVIGHGSLKDINDHGARFELDRRLEVNDRISLEVHFSNPDGAVTTIRFPGRVKRVFVGTSHEIAVSFSKGGAFLRRKDQLPRSLLPMQKGTEGNWIN